MKLTDLTTDEQTKLTQQLTEEEEVQWLGRPAPFAFLSRDFKKNQILYWIIAGVVLAAAIIGYSIWAIQTGSHYKIGMVAALVLVCAYIFVGLPLTEWNSLSKRAFFCITNKRVMTFVGDREVVLLNRSGLKVRVVDGENGCSHIALGAAANLKPSRLRVTALNPVKDDNLVYATGTVFYSIKDAKEVVRLLSDS